MYFHMIILDNKKINLIIAINQSNEYEDDLVEKNLNEIR